MYITINNVAGQVVEVFAHIGKSGGCVKAQTESLCVTISKALHAGADAKDVAKGLVGVRCNEPTMKRGKPHILSCSDAIGKAILFFYDEELMFNEAE